MTVAPACPHCHLIHATDWAVAVDRWRPEGPAGYRARYPDAPLRATRAEAIADMCARHAVLPPGCTCAPTSATSPTSPYSRACGSSPADPSTAPPAARSTSTPSSPTRAA